jgi:hypothetical protein
VKTIRVISTTAAFLLLGFTVPGFARQDKPEKQEEKPSSPKQEQPAAHEKQQQAQAPKQEPQSKPEKQQQAKAPKQEEPSNAEKQQQAKAPKQEQPTKPEKQSEQAKSTKQQPQHAQQVSAKHVDQPKTASSKGPQRTQEETARQHAQPALRLSARGTGRIPDDRFRSHFGRGHEFRMGDPVMVDGYSRFQYGGYWFGYVQPWPANWYYTDQCYIDYVDGGYYMYNPYYPGTRFALTVVL